MIRSVLVMPGFAKRVAGMPILGKLLQAMMGAIVRRRALRIRRNARVQARRLLAQSNGKARMIVMAISDCLTDTTSAEERIMLDRLERLRTEMDSCSTELLVTDYGAGSGDLHLSTEEMAAGRQTRMIVSDVYRRASQPPFWSLLLFKLVRQTKPAVCLELGTAIGISACYTAAALRLNSFGRLVTLEGSESLGCVAKENLGRLGLDNVSVIIGRFEDSLPEVLKRHEGIDFAFIDGHHDEKATLEYYRQIQPFLSEKRCWCSMTCPGLTV